MNRSLRHVLLGAVILLAIILRFYSLGQIPLSLSWDEVSLGYNAFSVLTNGQDEHGTLLPISNFPAFGDFKPPGYIYTAVISVWMFSLNEFAVRLPSAVAGVLAVLVVYLLVRELFRTKTSSIINYVALGSSFMLAISPWHINLSRTGFEANLANLLVLLGLFYLVRWLNLVKSNETNLMRLFVSLVLSSMLLVLALYTFNSIRIFIPVLLIIIGSLFWKHIIRHYKMCIAVGLLSLLIISPLIPHLTSSEGKLRFQEVNIFTDLEPVKISNQRIETHGGSVFAKLLHNRRVLFGVEVARHYLDNFNPNFLFINGDGNPKFSTRDVGQLYLWSLPFLFLGMYFLVKNKQGSWYLVLIWLGVGVLPASIARETPHALRIENTLPMWQIIVAYGFVNVMLKIKSYPLKRVLLFVLGLALVINAAYYIHGYYRYYPVEFAGSWQWGYREAIQEIQPLKKNYDVIRITESIGRPYIYVLFYEQYDPIMYNKTVDRRQDVYGFYHVDGFDKYEFGDELESDVGKLLYVQHPGSVPPEANIISTIQYPAGDTALVIYD